MTEEITCPYHPEVVLREDSLEDTYYCEFQDYDHVLSGSFVAVYTEDDTLPELDKYLTMKGQ